MTECIICKAIKRAKRINPEESKDLVCPGKLKVKVVTWKGVVEKVLIDGKSVDFDVVTTWEDING